MADNQGEEENTPRGNDWEVVSLTASTYAAAPGPKEVELKGDENECANGQGKAETSNALFMSGHFVFPPSQHENLSLEQDAADEIRGEYGGKGIFSEEARPSGKDEENWSLKGLAGVDVFPEVTLRDEKKVEQLPFRRKQFEGVPALEGLSLVDKQESIYTAAEYGSFDDEAALSGKTRDVAESYEACEGSNLSQDVFQSLDVPEDEKDNYSSDLPCGAWWKRRVASLYAHAKEANAFWSIFIAAAVMGLVMIGQRWQQERWGALHLKRQIRLNNEC